MTSWPSWPQPAAEQVRASIEENAPGGKMKSRAQSLDGELDELEAESLLPDELSLVDVEAGLEDLRA